MRSFRPKGLFEPQRRSERLRPDDDARGGRMPGQIVHFEIPADDTAQGREVWGSLFG